MEEITTSTVSVPEKFRCPLSLKIMVEPVIASDGHTYEKTEIEKIIAANDVALSPITQQPLNKNYTLIIDEDTKQQIITFVAKNKIHIDDADIYVPERWAMAFKESIISQDETTFAQCLDKAPHLKSAQLTAEKNAIQLICECGTVQMVKKIFSGHPPEEIKKILFSPLSNPERSAFYFVCLRKNVSLLELLRHYCTLTIIDLRPFTKLFIPQHWDFLQSEFIRACSDKDFATIKFYLALGLQEENVIASAPADIIYRVGKYYEEEAIVSNIPIPGKAIDYVRLAANNGSALAQCTLGIFYLEGKHTLTKNIDEAVYFLTTSAENGYADAQYLLGSLYYQGTDVTKNLAASFYYFELAAKQGHAHALHDLAGCYLHGHGTSKQETKAVKYYEKACKKGLLISHNQLANFYLKKDQAKKAVVHYKFAAKNGDAYAQNNLGGCYDRGEGVAKNFPKAAYYYYLAAQQNSLMAEKNFKSLVASYPELKKDYPNSALIEKEKAVGAETNTFLACITACEEGDEEFIATLLSKDVIPLAATIGGQQDGIDYKMTIGETLLFSAVLHGHKKIVSLLLSSGVKVSHALMQDAGIWGHIDVIELLLPAAALHTLSSSVANAIRFSCLKHASATGNATLLRFLIKKGFPVTLKNEKGKTAYDFALKYFQWETLAILAELKNYEARFFCELYKAVCCFANANSSAQVKCEEFLDALKKIIAKHGLTGDTLFKAVSVFLKTQEQSISYQNIKEEIAPLRKNIIAAMHVYNAQKTLHLKATDLNHIGKNISIVDIFSDEYINTDNEGGAMIYFTLAAMGDPTAQYNVAVMYFMGKNNVPQNDDEAAKWFYKSVEQEFTKSEFNLGVLYAEGRGVMQSDIQAKYWYQRAAEKGHVGAQLNLASYYLSKKQKPPALFWLLKAGAQELPLVQYNLAHFLAEEKRVEAAFYLYRSAAKQGHLLAQVNLGVAYESGEGVVQNFKLAVFWYQQAAQQGHILAECNLGMMYEKGRGVTQDYQKAIEWYRKAIMRASDKLINILLTYEKKHPKIKTDKTTVMYYHQLAEQVVVEYKLNEKNQEENALENFICPAENKKDFKLIAEPSLVNGKSIRMWRHNFFQLSSQSTIKNSPAEVLAVDKKIQRSNKNC